MAAMVLIHGIRATASGLPQSIPPSWDEEKRLCLNQQHLVPCGGGGGCQSSFVTVIEEKAVRKRSYELETKVDKAKKVSL